MNLPNALTVIRILLVPLFLYKMIKGEVAFATVVFLTAAITDGLDGFIARFWKMQTRLGTFLDPLADKLLISTSFIALAVLKNIPLWLALAVISRDVILALGSLTVYLMQGHLTVRPRPVGKVTTFFQFSCILVFLLASMGTNVAGAFLRITGPLALITAMLTVVSGAVYILDGFRALEE